MTVRIGADIGGTFTDLVLVDDRGGRVLIDKVLTTPDAPDEAVMTGVRNLLAAADCPGARVDQVVHGTTLFTNAVIERKGAPTALVTTRGFRDAVEIGREHRYDMYDLKMRRPAPLAPRRLRFEVTERTLADGRIHTALDEASVHHVVDRLVEEGIEALAICLLHAYANDTHERRIEEIVRARMPALAITRSSDLVPEIREYERTSTTLVNVYVKGIAERYLSRLRRRLTDETAVAGKLFVMQSNGGLSEVDIAARYPVRLIESGPAAGAIAAASFAAATDRPDILSFDMGGTTAKACLIVDGKPLIAPDFEVDRQYLFKKGSGFPVKVPVIEMIEIGTGGGSIAGIDAMRRLQVGPRSAGSKPGPASYGLGGDRPTVTDADLVLGFLDPDFFLGGEMALDVARARAAIETHVARPLGLGVEEAAAGIHQLANESMASAARMHAIERGLDIDRFTMFAFGGAGPVHAFGVARILRLGRIVYPLRAGVMSAIGFLSAPLSFDFVRSQPAPLATLDWTAAMSAIEEMEAEGRQVLGRTVPESELTFARFADMRYRKQGYEIRVPIPDGRLSAQSVATIRERFEQTYAALYGHTVPDAEIDVVSWRVIASGPLPASPLAAKLAAAAAPSTGAGAALKGERLAYRQGEAGHRPTPVYDRYRLAPGTSFSGPAIIEEKESTVVVDGPARISVDAFANLVVEIDRAPRA
ncbi:MAG: hydantoinase/oxoprolinase family protein [Rhizobiales bacterium]|nr:hydantoinase/oxoprolinase family protein [Hyphomicrobiales bacterium]